MVQSAGSSNEVLRLAQPESPREGGRDFVLHGGAASGLTSHHAHGSDDDEDDDDDRGRRGGAAKRAGGQRQGSAELMESVDFIGPADSMKGKPVAGFGSASGSWLAGAAGELDPTPISSVHPCSSHFTALFRLPYSRDSVSIALHRMGGMLVVDGALNELYDGPTPYASSSSPSSAANASKTGQQATGAKDPQPLDGTHAASTNSSSTSTSTSTSKCLVAPASFRLPPGPLHLPPAPRAHSQLLHFRLHDLNMMMGTDMKIFRCVYACVRIPLRPM